ncbi:MAG: hypothetical protein IJI01_00030 [Butyrivibrio sp.]|uniref:hypothetical protein n=1 Tax=Butyrivibrio sp. TaxID=28121 RepID=UPI0025BD0FE0|nr:hypothetical protein [Butyrivibrio sp.]MBQ6587046.1 hypothetical protein [Butyrivibrio sp.]
MKSFSKIGLIIAVMALCICGCSNTKEQVSKVPPFDGKDYMVISSMTAEGENPEEYAANYEPIKNFDTKLSVPTYITKLGEYWFIVDCYHNRVIYSDTLGAPLTDWYIMTADVTQPHTIASNGNVYMVDDTENHRVVIFEMIDGKFINTQTIYNIGNRPHYTVYDKETDTFYVWSSTTGELYCIRQGAGSSRLYITDIRKMDILDGIYVRSFSIIDGDIYFVSGVSDEGFPAKIYCCDLETLEVKKSYDVPANLAGMVQITKIDDYYYVSVSTDLSGSQDVATIVRARTLDDLAEGEYEDIYSQYFVGGGTPYYISNVDDTYFLTEHRLTDHQIWSFKVDNNEIVDVQTVY